jgi:hypothetical protein
MMVLGMLGPPALAQSFYLSPDVPTNLGGTTYMPWDVVRNDSGTYTLKLSLPPNTPVNGLHQMCKGFWLFTVEVPTKLGPNTYDPRDVIRYDPAGGTYVAFFNGAAAGVPVGSSVVAAFLNGDDSAPLILSFDVPTTIGGVTYDPADLVRYSGGAFSLFFDASAAAPPVPLADDVTGADRRGPATIITFDVPTTLGAATYLPGQLVAWDGLAFGTFYADPTWPAGSVLGDLSFLPDPGRVPPLSLRVDKSPLMPGGLTVSWAAALSAGAEDYGIYEGSLGTWYGHAAIDCNDAGGDLREDVAPAPGNRYYLVVPFNPNDEGSYGTNSAGVERPQGTSPCRPTQALNCP